jgi:hypothetical protein
MKRRRPNARYLLCLRNDGYPASLMTRRLYEQLEDADAEAHGLVRVVDESGDDYLYPEKLFTNLDLPEPVLRAIAA